MSWLIKIDQDKMLWWLIPGLLTVEIAILMLDALVTELGRISIGAARRFFNITREDGIPNFFSSFQMLSVGVVLLLITLVVSRQNRGSRSRVVWGWGLVTGLFFYMGLADATKLHERLGTIFSVLVTGPKDQPNPGLLGQLYDVFSSYTWQLIFGPSVAAAGLFVFIFLMRQLPALYLNLLVCSALGLFAIAMGMDFVEGTENGIMVGVADVFSTFPDRAVHFSKSIEESLEMAGSTIFLFVFLKTLMHTTPSISFEFSNQE